MDSGGVYTRSGQNEKQKVDTLSEWGKATLKVKWLKAINSNSIQQTQ